MTDGNAQSVPGNVGVVGGIAEQTAKAPCGQYNVFRIKRKGVTCFAPGYNTRAPVVFADQIDHGGKFMKFNVFPSFYLFQQLAGDFPAGHIIVKQDSGGRVGSLTGKGKCAALPPEIHTVVNQLVNDVR